MRAQHAMHDQIGIAANGRREVRVAGRGQREVALIAIAVAGLFERSQHQVAQDALLGFAFDLRDQLLIIARREVRHRPARPPGLRNRFTGAAPAAQRIAELRGDLFELQHALGIGTLVDAEDASGRPAASRCEATASFAASMNSSIRRCAMLRGARVTPVISPNSSNSSRGSGRSKSMEPRRTRLRFRISASSCIHSKRWTSCCVAFAQRRIAFEHAVDGRVGHALGAADDAASELLRDHVAVRVDFQQRATAPGGLRAAAASTDRSIAPPAAWARRDPESRRWCRAAALRDRWASRDARSGSRRRCAPAAPSGRWGAAPPTRRRRNRARFRRRW